MTIDSNYHEKLIERIEKISEAQREQKDISEMEKKNTSLHMLRPNEGQESTFTDDSNEMSEVLKKQYHSVFSEIKKISRVELGPTPLYLERAIDIMRMQSTPGLGSWNSFFIKNGKTSLVRAHSCSKDCGLGYNPRKSTVDLIYRVPVHRGGNRAVPTKSADR